METAAARLEKLQEHRAGGAPREDVKAMLEQRGRLLPLVVDTEVARAKVARGEADLAGATAGGFLSNDRLRSDAGTGGAHGRRAQTSALLGLRIKSQEANKVTQSIESSSPTIGRAGRAGAAPCGTHRRPRARCAATGQIDVTLPQGIG